MGNEEKHKAIYIGYTMFICGKCTSLITSFSDRCEKCGALIDRNVNLVEKEDKNEIHGNEAGQDLPASKGISEEGIRSIQSVLIDEAIRQNDNLTTARFFTAVALVLHDELGFGPKRMPRTLHAIDEKIGEVASGEKSWNDLMQELKDKTGMFINCDPEWTETKIEENAKEV